MAKPRYGQKRTNPLLRWGYTVLFGIVFLWLISSIAMKKSPTEVLSSFFSKLPNPEGDSNRQMIVKQDSIIESLKTKLAACEGTGKYKRGMVIVDSETMNLRSEPSLVSNIIMRIPTNSEVDVIFYDTETYYLNGKAGKWCKIRYAGTEGWAWGNFIEEF